jgi:GNAT superfamily N-acetyltransferase
MPGIVAQSLDRLARFRRRHGLASLPVHAVRAACRRAFQNDHFVYLMNRSAPGLPEASGLRVERFAAEAEIPGEILGRLVAQEGRGILPTIRAEFAHRAALWIGLIGPDAAAFQWSRRGADIDRWFLTLSPRDVVIFGTVTFPPFRGRGISPAMMQHIARRETEPGARVYVDCKVWNVPAQRGITKAGFNLVGRMPPLGRGRRPDRQAADRIPA